MPSNGTGRFKIPRSGADVYSVPAGTTAAPNTLIESAKYNAFVADVAADLNLARPISSGGTAATTAAGARTNLGGTAVGVAVFTAVDAAAGRTAISAQESDATLDGLATLGGVSGIVTQTATNTFTKRNIAVTGLATITNPAGVGGDYTVGVPEASTVEARAATSGTVAMTPRRVAETALGWGQTWQVVTGSRVVGTSYQNTTGRPISVHAQSAYGGSLIEFQVSVDNVTWVTVANTASANGSDFTFVVPNTQYYRQLNGTLALWTELR